MTTVSAKSGRSGMKAVITVIDYSNCDYDYAGDDDDDDDDDALKRAKTATTTMSITKLTKDDHDTDDNYDKTIAMMSFMVCVLLMMTVTFSIVTSLFYRCFTHRVQHIYGKPPTQSTIIPRATTVQTHEVFSW